MSQSNDAGWQAYAKGESANLTTALEKDRQSHDEHQTSFMNEWMTLSAPQKAAAIGELSREAAAGNVNSADTLRTALGDTTTPNDKQLNESLRQLGFQDVSISDDNNGMYTYKAANVQGANGSFYHANSWGDVIAQNNPNFGDGKYYANGQAVFDEINALGLPGSVFNPNKDNGLGLPTDAQRAAMLQQMAQKGTKSIGEQ